MCVRERRERECVCVCVCVWRRQNEAKRFITKKQQQQKKNVFLWLHFIVFWVMPVAVIQMLFTHYFSNPFSHSVVAVDVPWCLVKIDNCLILSPLSHNVKWLIICTKSNCMFRLNGFVVSVYSVSWFLFVVRETAVSFVFICYINCCTLLREKMSAAISVYISAR